VVGPWYCCLVQPLEVEPCYCCLEVQSKEGLSLYCLTELAEVLVLDIVLQSWTLALQRREDHLILVEEL